MQTTDDPIARRRIYSVSALTHDIKALLEKNYPMIWICGEISNLRIPSSGHAYFTLKDNKAQIAAVMFRGQLRQLTFEPADGIDMIGLGRIGVYEPRGTYQIIIEYAEPKGAGALQLAFEQLKQKLGREGLFDPVHKSPLPFLPHTIAVITSATGAVIRDILNVLERRFPSVHVEIAPVRVQGNTASGEIVKALHIVNERAKADVIILARGGGSMEDMAAFNTEEVARAIFASDIPVVSAVGHETDFSIADFVADVRAPTPSAAAELVVPVKAQLQAHCMGLHQRCTKAIMRTVVACRDRFRGLRRSLVHPMKTVQERQMRVDDLAERLHRAVITGLQSHRSMVDRNHYRLLRHTPMASAAQGRQKLALLNFKLTQSMVHVTREFKKRISFSNAALSALNPQAVLQRGYSITRTMDTKMVVMNSNSVAVDQKLEVTLAAGRLHVKVTEKRTGQRGSDGEAVV